jgi:hypothetical protein
MAAEETNAGSGESSWSEPLDDCHFYYPWEMWSDMMETIIVGFMRLITLNYPLWGKPTNLGWRKVI